MRLERLARDNITTDFRRKDPFALTVDTQAMWFDKLCKLHGYPQRYKLRQKLGLNNQTRSSNQVNCVVVYQVSEHQVPELAMDQTQGDVGSFMQTLNRVQYQHLISMLSTHLKATKMDTKMDANPANMSDASQFL